MNPVSPYLAIASFVLALFTAFLLEKTFPAPSKARPGRSYDSIDGLRCYLAFSVFLCHSSIWYFYLRSGKWDVPPSNLYTHFGESSVVFFFNITAFLFSSKIMDGRARGIDWSKLFVSRFLRIAPLYLFVMFLNFGIVAYLSNGILREPTLKLVAKIIYWIMFTFPGAPNLNGVTDTGTIVGGVTWSLPYEWFFYFSLPLISIILRVIPPFRYVIFSMLSIIVLLVIWHPQIHFFIPFLSGIGTSFLARSELFCRFAIQKISSWIVILLTVIVINFYPSAYSITPLLLLAIAFAIIACGNDIFGLLVSSASRTLGEIAYSIYLMQGILLFVTFKLIIGVDKASVLSPLTHGILIIVITPILLIVCSLTFRFIEQPAMLVTKPLIGLIRSHRT